jgi:hypothetical protein
MKKKILLVCVLLLLLVQSADAASSANYRVDWNNLLTGSGGPASSTLYKVNFTVGQTVSKPSASPHYRIQTGYWADIVSWDIIYAPRAAKNP